MQENALFIAIAAAFVVWFVMQRMGKVPAPRAHQLVQDGALLVDVRSPGEFAGGHLPGALSVPVTELNTTRASELAKKGKPVVVYCASGMRSASAARVLKQAGVQVFDLGAMSRW